MRAAFVCLGLLLCAGCSESALYKFGQDLGRGKADCEALTVADERAACEAEFERTFEQYKQERSAL